MYGFPVRTPICHIVPISRVYGVGVANFVFLHARGRNYERSFVELNSSVSEVSGCPELSASFLAILKRFDLLNCTPARKDHIASKDKRPFS